MIDNNDNSPIPGARIFAGNNLSTTTDINGNFKLNVPVSVSQFTVSMVGYQIQVIHIDPAKTAYPIKIRETAMTMGEVIITKPPFFKRVYYRFIKRPIRKLFKAI